MGARGQNGFPANQIQRFNFWLWGGHVLDATAPYCEIAIRLNSPWEPFIGGGEAENWSRWEPFYKQYVVLYSKIVFEVYPEVYVEEPAAVAANRPMQMYIMPTTQATISGHDPRELGPAAIARGSTRSFGSAQGLVGAVPTCSYAYHARSYWAVKDIGTLDHQRADHDANPARPVWAHCIVAGSGFGGGATVGIRFSVNIEYTVLFSDQQYINDAP